MPARLIPKLKYCSGQDNFSGNAWSVGSLSVTSWTRSSTKPSPCLSVGKTLASASDLRQFQFSLRRARYVQLLGSIISTFQFLHYGSNDEFIISISWETFWLSSAGVFLPPLSASSLTAFTGFVLLAAPDFPVFPDVRGRFDLGWSTSMFSHDVLGFAVSGSERSVSTNSRPFLMFKYLPLQQRVCLANSVVC